MLRDKLDKIEQSGIPDADAYDFEDYGEEHWQKMTGLAQPTREMDPKFRRELLEQGVEEKDIGFFTAEFEAAREYNGSIHDWRTLCDLIMTEESTPERQDEGLGREVTHKGVMDYFWDHFGLVPPMPSGKLRKGSALEEYHDRNASIMADLWILLKTEHGLVPAMRKEFPEATINKKNVVEFFRNWFAKKHEELEREYDGPKMKVRSNTRY